MITRNAHTNIPPSNSNRSQLLPLSRFSLLISLNLIQNRIAEIINEGNPIPKPMPSAILLWMGKPLVLLPSVVLAVEGVVEEDCTDVVNVVG
jgi:hypothetical protein